MCLSTHVDDPAPREPALPDPERLEPDDPDEPDELEELPDEPRAPWPPPLLFSR